MFIKQKYDLQQHQKAKYLGTTQSVCKNFYVEN